MSAGSSATKRLATLVVAAIVIVVVVRTTRRAPESGPKAAAPAAESEPRDTANAERVRVPDREEVVGSVRPRRVVRVAAQVPARVLEVARDAGERVHAGEVLVRLDDRESAARLRQTREALAAAEAAGESAHQREVQADARLGQARAAYDRAKGLFERQAATQAQLEDAERANLEAQAGLAEARALVATAAAQREAARAATSEAEAALTHLTLTAPFDGLVSERRVEPGDLANPGEPLLVLLDPNALRVEAGVREGLIARLARGTVLPVEIPATGARLQGTVSEVLPSADARTRTFEVRVDLPAPKEGALVAHAGMFARIAVDVGEREVVRAPAAALQRVGQLWTVLVEESGAWRRRVVTRGVDLGGGAVEVTSGLVGGERLALGDGRP